MSQSLNKNNFFHRELFETGKRIEPIATGPQICLNKNESAYELDDTTKKQVVDRLLSVQWKKYPSPYYPGIEEKIADYCGVLSEQVVVAAGSANIITSLINYFAANQRDIIVAEPSFSLYSYHCKSYNVKYKTWPLNESLEYDVSLFPEYKGPSLVLLASPNNPVGNIISQDQLITLLTNNPQCLFLLDEVYNEFSNTNYTPLIQSFPNLILLRSFSKVFSSAGLRAGYLIADKIISDQVRKLILPFSLNHFTAEFLSYILSSKDIIKIQKDKNAFLISERERVFAELTKISNKDHVCRILPSGGNFLLIRFNNEDHFQIFKSTLSKKKLALLDVSSTPVLRWSIRMSIGIPEENNLVIEAFKSTVKSG